MWIVRLALRRPYTFVVMAVLIAILGGLAIATLPVDIFPYIDIPVASIVWQYGGLSPEEMESRIVTNFERALTSNVVGIEHIESQSHQSIAVVRVYFHPNTPVDLALSQIVTQCNVTVRNMPPGTFPPQVLKYDAASVPILQLGLSSEKLQEQEIFDLGNNFIRTPLATVQGATVSYPFGGKNRQIMVDLNLDELYAKRLSPIDVSNALNLQNLILPAGTAKFADTEYPVRLNSSVAAIDDFNSLPIKTVNGATVYIRDVATVHDGFVPQTSVVRTNGSRGVLLTVTRNGRASTLTVVSAIKDALPRILSTVTQDLHVSVFGDQSLFVRSALGGVLRETLIAAFLTGSVILLFLGSWRSTLIVCLSIPLSILTSICILNLLGQTINVMTLGGLALAVGILVDDATVEIENTHRNLAMRKPLVRAVLDGAQQIAVPAFVSTLAICIVFVPVLLLTGAAKYLFTPLALAVVFAMLASYLLSRTLVPVMVKYLIRGHEGEKPAPNFFTRIQQSFEKRFENLRQRYVDALAWSLQNRATIFVLFAILVASAFVILPGVGRDFFPNVDAGQFRLHVNAPPGTRLEENEQIFSRVEDVIREVVPSSDIATVIDDIGTPQFINLAFTDNSTISAADGEILVSLKPDHRGSTPAYLKTLRETLATRFPDLSFYFQPADIVSQILNFGLPAPIDIQVAGYAPQNYGIAREIEARVKQIPGAVDVGLHQITNAPELKLKVDRTRAQELGFTERDVANSVLISLSGTSQVTPNFWADPKTGINYPVAIQTPQHLADSVDALTSTSLAGREPAHPQLLSNIVSLDRAETPAVESHTNVQPVFDIYANVQGADLGRVSDKVTEIVNEFRPKLAPGSTVIVRGQVESMNTAFGKLGLGLIFAAVLIYFLMVVNFQSWTDPFIIITALPGAFAGILWMLFLTQTTFSVPSLMGATMSIGVATANSILLVTFANEQREEGLDARS